MNRPLYHGDALDAAIARSQDPTDLHAEVCESALYTRTTSFVDGQIEWMADEAIRADVAGKLRATLGRDPLATEVDALLLRSVIGGSLTIGLQAGLALRHESKSATS